MQNKGALSLDHVAIGCADLDALVAAVWSACGVRAGGGGRHVGAGTRNALAGLGETLYLELIAPDPAQAAIDGLAARLRGLNSPAGVLVAYRASDLHALARKAAALGLICDGPRAMSRRGEDGVLLTWRLLFVTGAPDLPLPFFIDWGGVGHPSSSASPGLRLEDLVFETPRPDALHAILEAMDVRANIRAAEKPAFRIEVRGPSGGLRV